VIQAVLFDLDGVLIDSYPIWRRVLNAALQEFGKPPVLESEFRATWGQSAIADRDRWFPELTVSEMESTFARHFLRHTDAARVMDGAIETLRALRRRGLPVGVVTNSPRPIAGPLMQAAGLSEIVDLVVHGSDVVQPKPSPEMVLLAIRRFDVAPERVLMIGDTDNDRRAAEAAGCRYLHFGRDLRSLPALLERLDEHPPA
jgi:HAD superfamily hydrolase (TIGR01509 family)